MKNVEVKFLGIRHHGPGSALNLKTVLENMSPSHILIEGPADAQAMLDKVDPEDFIPPLSLLMYNEKDLGQAAFFPMAEYSPEWQAIIWAKQHQIPVDWIDMPQGQQIHVYDDYDHIPDLPEWQRDPLGYLARGQGYKDVEDWWEAYFETTQSDDIFEDIESLMQLLRAESSQGDTDRQNVCREAYMREAIRKTAKRSKGPIAVVCGAWHVPALKQFDTITSVSDKAILKGLKTSKMKSIWIPWSYERLSKASGYRAGVKSPMWYDILFRHHDDPSNQWMAYLGFGLRKKGYDIPPSMAIDASRLSIALASMRGMQKPGLTELSEAAISVFGYKDERLLQFVYDDLPIGHKVGNIPDRSEKVPIQADFEKQVKSFRLSKVIDTGIVTEKSFDLRKELHQQATAFLNQLILIEVPIGSREEHGGLGTFKEVWTLKWQPDYYFRLIEAGSYGLTVRSAAIHKVREAVNGSEDVTRLLMTLERALDADLPEVLDSIIDALSRHALDTNDSFLLLDMFNGLSKILISGHARYYDESVLAQLRADVILPVVARFRQDVNALTLDKASEVYESVLLADRYLYKKPIASLASQWQTELIAVGLESRSVNAVNGLCLRLMSEKGKISDAQSLLTLKLVLSDTHDAPSTVNWLEGFFQNNFLILLYNEDLWNNTNIWLSKLDETAFDAILPLLRKVFSSCDDGLRTRLFEKVAGKYESLWTDKQSLPNEIKGSIDDLFA